MTESDEQAAVILCRPVDPRKLMALGEDTPIPNPHNHSTLTICMSCGDPMWIGPGQLEKSRQYGESAFELCFLCGAALLEGHEDLEIRSATDNMTPVMSPYKLAGNRKVEPHYEARGLRCRRCDNPVDAWGAPALVGREKPPEPPPGSIHLCAYCGELSMVTSGRDLRLPDEKEKARWENHYQVREARRMMRRAAKQVHRPWPAKGRIVD